MTVHLGPVTVAITSWVAKPGSPGEYVGFYYTVSPGTTGVTVDVKAGQSLTRTVVTGTGLWPPESTFTGSQGRCRACLRFGFLAQSGRLDVHNSGTIPAVVSLEWAYGPSAGCSGRCVVPPPPDPDCCRFFDVLVEDAASGAVLFGGPLCDLLDRPIFVSPQLDPGQSLALDIAVTLASRGVPGRRPDRALALPGHLVAVDQRPRPVRPGSTGGGISSRASSRSG